WKDVNGKLWVFGGNASSTVQARKGDLWQYDADPSSSTYNQWAFMKGLSTTAFAGIYGVIGVPDQNNMPGARAGSATWVDNSGNFYLFGGVPGSGYFNDMWRLAPVITIPAQPGLFTAA